MNAANHGDQQGTGGNGQPNSFAMVSKAGTPSPSASNVVAPVDDALQTAAPKSPDIAFYDRASTATEFRLDETGFPAITTDGKIVALAFHELQDAGPPALELSVQLRSVASGRVVYETKFREAYQGERGADYLDALRGRVQRWLVAVSRKLAQSELASMNPIVHDETAVCSDSPQPIVVPAGHLQVQFSAGRLVLRSDHAEVLFERAYPEWTIAFQSRAQRCVFEPYVTVVSFDAKHQVVVVRADHCSPGDLCARGVVPNYAIIVLSPNPEH